ncbi:MAG: acyl carrier protein [Cyclobacteriaceae bacterium]
MRKNLIPPMDLVAKALNISVDQLNEQSAYGKTLNWDSLNHLDVIRELETNYNIQIPDSEIENYSTMKEIIKLFEELNG